MKPLMLSEKKLLIVNLDSCLNQKTELTPEIEKEKSQDIE